MRFHRNISTLFFLYLFNTIQRIEAFVLPTDHTIGRSSLPTTTTTTKSGPTVFNIGRSATILASSEGDNEGRSSQQPQGLVAMGTSLQSQLASAFSALDESDQYDAVLTGLCAKILDDTSLSGDGVLVAIQDALRLVEEMNTRRVVMASRSVMALVDVSC
jgi:hypothetical protein